MLPWITHCSRWISWGSSLRPFLSRVRPGRTARPTRRCWLSIHVMSWVLRHSEERLGNRLVLLALAEFAHDDGTKAYPAVATLTERARLSERQVQSALKALQEHGAIELTGKSPKGTNVYRVIMGGADSAPPQNPTDDQLDSAPNPRHDPSVLSLDGGGGAMPKEWPLPTVDRRKVTPFEANTALAILASFNAEAGTSYRSKDFLRAIVGRIREHAELTLEEHTAIIRANLHDPWWKGEAAPNVVYGSSATFDRARERAKGTRNGQGKRNDFEQYDV